MRSRFLLLASVLVLLSSFAVALDVGPEVPMRKRTISGGGSSSADPETIRCTNRYYHVCGPSKECVDSSQPGSCCNECVFPYGTVCQACSAGV
jgi:hypothetical protein